MKALFWVLALFALAVGVSLAAHYNDGYLLVVLPPYRAEISLNLAIVLLIASFLVVYAVVRAMALTFALPQRVRAFRERRRRERAGQDFHEAVRLIFAGRYSLALKKAADAHFANHSPGLAALLAARAAQRLREPEKQQTWLARAAQSEPTLRPACLMLEAEMLIETCRFTEAIDALQRLRELAGRHIAALRLELRACQGSGNWDEVLRLSRLLGRHHGLPAASLREIAHEAHQENIRTRHCDRAALLAYQHAMPQREVSPLLARAYAEALISLKADEQARCFIAAQLEYEWDSRLAGLYGHGGGNDRTADIACAERWLLDHRDDPELLLALGRMCLAGRQWDQAQSHLEASLALVDRHEVRLELARLFELTARADLAMMHYRAAAEQLRSGVASADATDF